MIKSDCGHSISSYRLWSISASLVVGEVTDVVFLLSVCFILHDPFYRTMVLGMFVVERMAHEPLLYLYILEKQKYLTLTQGKKRFYSSKPRNYLHLKTCLLFSALGDWSLRRTLTSSCATSASASFSGRWATNSGQVGVVDFACCEEKCLAICLTSG